MGQIGSIIFWVSSDSIRVVSDFGSLQFWVGLVLGGFNFGFRLEIGSTLSHVASGLVSGRSIQVNRIGLLLPGLLEH